MTSLTYTVVSLSVLVPYVCLQLSFEVARAIWRTSTQSIRSLLAAILSYTLSCVVNRLPARFRGSQRPITSSTSSSANFDTAKVSSADQAPSEAVLSPATSEETAETPEASEGEPTPLTPPAQASPPLRELHSPIDLPPSSVYSLHHDTPLRPVTEESNSSQESSGEQDQSSALPRDAGASSHALHTDAAPLRLHQPRALSPVLSSVEAQQVPPSPPRATLIPQPRQTNGVHTANRASTTKKLLEPVHTVEFPTTPKRTNSTAKRQVSPLTKPTNYAGPLIGRKADVDGGRTVSLPTSPADARVAKVAFEAEGSVPGGHKRTQSLTRPESLRRSSHRRRTSSTSSSSGGKGKDAQGGT